MCPLCGGKKDSTLQTLVYRCETTDRWILIDYDDDPSNSDWVMTRRDSDDQITIERFHGQEYYGVVVTLRDYWQVHKQRYDPPQTARG
jgi:hypothetical protein